MSPKKAALRSQDSTSLPGSNQAVGGDAGHGSASASLRPAHLSLVPSVVGDEKPAFAAPRRRRWIASAVGVVVVVGLIIGIAVLPDDTPAPASADQHPQPAQPAEHVQRRPTVPGTTAPAAPETQDEPPPEGNPRTPVATTTPQAPQSTNSGAEDTTPPSGGADPGPGPSPTPVAPPAPHAPPSTPPPAVTPPPTTPPPLVTANGVVNGCDTYGQSCGDNPLYAEVPPAGYDYTTWPKVTTVANGATLTARCWARGGITYNYAAWFDPPDYGDDPYESDVYFNVRVAGGDQWAWIPDTYFVRDKNGRMGLPEC